jgi:hypothetical protein
MYPDRLADVVDQRCRWRDQHPGKAWRRALTPVVLCSRGVAEEKWYVPLRCSDSGRHSGRGWILGESETRLAAPRRRRLRAVRSITPGARIETTIRAPAVSISTLARLGLIDLATPRAGRLATRLDELLESLHVTFNAT